jgi:hypothetical protein
VLVEGEKFHVLFEFDVAQPQLNLRAQCRNIPAGTQTEGERHPPAVRERITAAKPLAKPGEVKCIRDIDDVVCPGLTGAITNVSFNEPIPRAGTLAALSVHPVIQLPRKVTQLLHKPIVTYIFTSGPRRTLDGVDQPLLVFLSFGLLPRART